MSELTTFLEERKKERYEILEEKIKELEGKIKEEKTENDNVDDVDIETKKFKKEFEIILEHMEEKLRHYKKNAEILRKLQFI
jgi:DNA-binding transcriptional MerR regulator